MNVLLHPIRFFISSQRYFIYLSVLFVLTAAMNAQALTISGVSVNPRVIDLAKQQQVTLQFALDEPAKVQMNWFDARELQVYTRDLGLLNAADHQVVWDGRDQQGDLVPAEAYHYTLVATNAADTRVEYDLTDLTGGDTQVLRDVTYDAQSKQLSYRLDKPARVDIRVGLAQGGPLLKKVLDWKVRDAGLNKEYWDGWDSSHVLEFHDHPNLKWSTQAFELPSNMIQVVGASNALQFIEPLPWGKTKRVIKKVAKYKVHAPQQRPADKRGDFPLDLSLVGNYPQAEGGARAVSGIVPVRLNIPAEHLARLASQRFEPVFFVDGLFVYENEVGFFPMTYNWDSSKHSPGVHYITANLRGYLGNFGIATLKVIIKDNK